MTQTVLLGAVTTKIGSGATPRGGANSYLDEGPFALIRSQNIRDGAFDYNGLAFINEQQADKLKNVDVQPRDVLINITGDSVARVGRVPKDVLPARVNQHVAIIRPDENDVDSRFLYYSLIEPRMNKHLLTLASTGATRNALTKIQLEKLKIELPDLEIQKKIADILATIDEKIELNRKMNETLEQMGQALFRHYFIDNPETQKWEDRKFLDVADILTGKGSTKSQLSGNGVIPLYGANGVMGTSEDYLYNEPLVITGRVGTLGKVRAVTGKAWFSDNVLIMRPKVASFGFIYHLAQTFDYISMNRGSTQPLVTQTDLKNRKIRVPDTQTLDKFEQQFSKLFEQQQNNEQQIQTLTTLRDTLLPRLINGKVKV